MDLIKQAQSACLFPEFWEEEKRLVARLAEYARLLPEPTGRDWTMIAVTWVLILAAFVALPFWLSGAIGRVSTLPAFAPMLMFFMAALIAVCACRTLNRVRMDQLKTPPILAVQEQITTLGGRVSALFQAHKKGIIVISQLLFKHLETCVGIRNANLEAARDEIDTLFEARRPDALHARRNQRVKTKVPRESDYTIEDFVGGSNNAMAALGKAIGSYRSGGGDHARQPPGGQPATAALQRRLKAHEKSLDMECRTELRILRVTLQSNHQRLMNALEARLDGNSAADLVGEAARLTQANILDPVDRLLERFQAAQDIVLDTAYSHDQDASQSWTIRIAAVTRQLTETRRSRHRKYRLARLIGGWIPLAACLLILMLIVVLVVDGTAWRI